MVLDQERKKTLSVFQKNTGLRFRSFQLLNLSFIHRSSINESLSPHSNERLEFLGDAVLGSVAASLLYELLDQSPEGELAKVKSAVVSEKNLAEVSRALGISELLILGKGEEHSGGREKSAILADALEALIGAYYLDSGYKAAFHFIESWLSPTINKALEERHKNDYKSALQELSQSLYRVYPQYRFVKKTGPDHDRLFWMEVLIQGKVLGDGQGRNKKAAEQLAAEKAYNYLIEKSSSQNG